MFKIKNLTYQYDKKRKALDNINMDFDCGDIIGIIVFSSVPIFLNAKAKSSYTME